jgi:signal transduction histidine kinase
MTEDRQPNKQFTEKALANVIKLEQLIKDLLDVSKIQSGQLQLNIKEFDIDALINESIASFQMMSHKHKIILQSSLHGEMISADRQRIEQVMINLLSNAIKYSPEAEEVIVTSKIKNDDLIIQVRDFGIGIPQDETSEIFERFYRTKDSSIHISGFGLGLYICRDIISRHKGRIWVEKESKGTSFYFSLPMSTNQKNQTL